MTFLRQLALGHQRLEGWHTGSLSQRNLNPGNLRLTEYQKIAYRATEGQGNFAKFPTYEIGLQALMDDLRAKIMGNSRHIDYSSNPTFLDYVKVYAPESDGNSPVSYATNLLREISEYGINLLTPLAYLAQIIAEDESPKHKESFGVIVRRMKRELRTATGRAKAQILRKLKRLLAV